MKINLQQIDQESFKLIQEEHFGEKWTLVYPFISAAWNKQNLIFRSSLWNEEGELISAGFPKFFNWGEKPNLNPPPDNLKNTQIVEKLDGSLLIVSKYKGLFIFRTRGTIDAYKHDNGNDLDELFKKYPLVEKHFQDDTCNFSLLFEWTTPNCKIIINYGSEVEFSLVGGINHDNYKLFDQNELNHLANHLNLKRPKVYSFSTIDEMIKAVEELRGNEGVVVYSKNDQVLHKVKSAWYLSLHHMKSELTSLEKTLDVWLKFEKPNFNTFYTTILNQFDFEIAEYSKGNLSKICDASKEVLKIFDHMIKFVEPLKNEIRKDAAIKIIQSYGKTNRASICFKLLDGKEIIDDDWKKVMLQVLK